MESLIKNPQSVFENYSEYINSSEDEYLSQGTIQSSMQPQTMKGKEKKLTREQIKSRERNAIKHTKKLRKKIESDIRF